MKNKDSDTMKCNIEYVGKARNGKPKYYCTTHKSFAHDKLGNKLDECLCSNKEIYNNKLNIRQNEIKSIIIKYENILESVIPKITINSKEFNGVLEYDNSLLTYKDFGGIMLANLNNIPLEIVKCSHCAHYHSDNGQFAYTPHRIHLCLYCGHLFRAKEKNVGSELAMIYDIPKIELQNKLLKIDDYCCVEYDMLKGILLINNQNINKILFKGKELDIIEFLNHILENEF